MELPPMLHTIVLKYKEVAKTTSAPHVAKDAENAEGGEYKYEVEASKTEIRKKGDTMAFTTESGYVTVELPPEHFKPRLFSTDPYFCQQNNLKVGAPVEIIKELPEEFKYWCGFSVGYPGDFNLGVPDGGH